MKYPTGVIFVVLLEFFERLAFYGMLALLSIYIRDKLKFEEDTSTVIFHIFYAFSYFTPVVGAIVADSWLGKYKTITIMLILYCAGMIMLTFGAAPFLRSLIREMTLTSLVLIALGAGMIKPCIAAFGGDQFQLPDQEKQLSKFFSIFYFSINCGSLIAMTLNPVLRSEIQCLGDLDCYPLAFSVSAGALVLGTVTIIMGTRWYTIKKPTGNVVLRVSKCIAYAISQKMKLKGTTPQPHWLDYAQDKYGADLIAEIKVVLRILVLYLPVPIFWALFDQQGSRWTFQATRMRGEIGATYTMRPEHMQVVNPLIVLILIPFCEFFLYPALDKCKLATPLRKLTIGGIVASAAFVISGFIELELQKSYPVLPGPGVAQLRIINGYESTAFVKIGDSSVEIPVSSLGIYENKNVPVKGSTSKTLTIKSDALPEEERESGLKEIVKITEETAVTLFLFPNGSKSYVDDVDKSSSGFPAVRVLFVAAPGDETAKVQLKDTSMGTVALTVTVRSWGYRYFIPSLVQGVGAPFWICMAMDLLGIYYRKGHQNVINLNTVTAAYYDVLVGGKKVQSNFKLGLGGVFTLVIVPTALGTYKTQFIAIAEPNSMHMLWLTPQFAVLTLGEVMFSVTGLEFSFSEAPVSMKSVLQACWLLTVTFGNIIVVIIAEANFIKQQSIEFFLFAALMLADMAVFAILAKRYKPSRFTAETVNQET